VSKNRRAWSLLLERWQWIRTSFGSLIHGWILIHEKKGFLVYIEFQPMSCEYPLWMNFLGWINMTEEWRQLDFAPTVEATHDSVRINPLSSLSQPLSGCCWVRVRLDKLGARR
jgi:hypothetical protein